MLNTFIKVMKAPFFLLTALIVLIVNNGDLPAREGFIEPQKTQTFVLFDALFRAQGVTNDGGYFYFSWNYGLLKTELDGETVVRQNLFAIPWALMKLGCKHIGGITHYNGKIYVTIEDSKVFEHLYMARYDAETLKLIDYKALPLEHHENGAPWCAANPDEGVIYSARRDRPEALNVYDAETMERVGTLPLTSTVPVHKVQGGDMYGGTLYLSVSRDSHAVFSVDVSTGEVKVAFERFLADGSEGEGMTVLPMEDGTFFHILDIAKIKLGGHFRHYAADRPELKTTEDVVNFYKEAAEKTDKAGVTLNTVMLLSSLDGGSGAIGTLLNLFEPIARRALSDNSTPTDGIVGNYKDLTASDVESANATDNGKTTTVSIVLKDQTDGVTGNQNGSVAHGIGVLDGVDVAIGELDGVTVDYSSGTIELKYTDATIEVTVDNATGKITGGTWHYAVNASLDNIKVNISFISATLRGALGVIDYRITL